MNQKWVAEGLQSKPLLELNFALAIPPRKVTVLRRNGRLQQKAEEARA